MSRQTAPRWTVSGGACPLGAVPPFGASAGCPWLKSDETVQLMKALSVDDAVGPADRPHGFPGPRNSWRRNDRWKTARRPGAWRPLGPPRPGPLATNADLSAGRGGSAYRGSSAGPAMSQRLMAFRRHNRPQGLLVSDFSSPSRPVWRCASRARPASIAVPSGAEAGHNKSSGLVVPAEKQPRCGCAGCRTDWARRVQQATQARGSKLPRHAPRAFPRHQLGLG